MAAGKETGTRVVGAGKPHDREHCQLSGWDSSLNWGSALGF